MKPPLRSGWSHDLQYMCTVENKERTIFISSVQCCSPRPEPNFSIHVWDRVNLILLKPQQDGRTFQFKMLNIQYSLENAQYCSIFIVAIVCPMLQDILFKRSLEWISELYFSKKQPSSCSKNYSCLLCLAVILVCIE